MNDFNDLGERIVSALGEPAARELLDVLTRSEADRATLIGRLHLRDDAAWLAKMLIDIEEDEAVGCRLPTRFWRCFVLGQEEGHDGTSEWLRIWADRIGGEDTASPVSLPGT